MQQRNREPMCAIARPRSGKGRSELDLLPWLRRSLPFLNQRYLGVRGENIFQGGVTGQNIFLENKRYIHISAWVATGHNDKKSQSFISGWR